MNRRTLFGRLLAGAAAFVVAPAVTVEAAPAPIRDPLDMLAWIDAGGNIGMRDDLTLAEARGVIRDLLTVQVQHEARVREARAEGYNRGLDVGQANAESRSLHGESGG